MSRGVRIPIDQKITIQQNAVDKAKEKYQAEVEKLNDLLSKKEEERGKEVLDAIKESGKSLDDVLEFLKK